MDICDFYPCKIAYVTASILSVCPFFMFASGGNAAIGGFPIVVRVIENKLLRLGRAPVGYLCLLWSLSS